MSIWRIKNKYFITTFLCQTIFFQFDTKEECACHLCYDSLMNAHLIAFLFN